MSNPYERMVPETKFAKVVDKAIEEANQRFLVDVVVQRAAEEGERWRHIWEAEEAAGPHAVVVPLASAKALLAALEGREAKLPRDLMVAALRDRIGQTERRGEKE